MEKLEDEIPEHVCTDVLYALMPDEESRLKFQAFCKAHPLDFTEPRIVRSVWPLLFQCVPDPNRRWILLNEFKGSIAMRLEPSEFSEFSIRFDKEVLKHDELAVSERSLQSLSPLKNVGIQNLKKLIGMRDELIRLINEKKLERLSGLLGGEDFVRKHTEAIKEIMKIRQDKEDKDKNNWIDFYFYSDENGFENIGMNLKEGIYEGTYCKVETRLNFLNDLLDRADAQEIIDLLGEVKID